MNEEIQNRVYANSAGLTLDVATTQYSVQWSKIGNLQTSASSILTLISFIAAIVLCVVSSQKAGITNEVTYQAIAFFISLIMSIFYMILSCVFMYLILKTKYTQGLSNPNELHKQVMEAVKEKEDESYTEEMYILQTSIILLDKINSEIENTDLILQKNRFWYAKCLNSSFFSLFGSILSLLFVNSSMFNNNNFFVAVLSIMSFSLLLGIFVLILFPRNKK